MQQAAAAVTRPAKKGDIKRFNTRQRVEHYILMVVFTLLAITGLIQRYYTVGICKWLILHLGGIAQTRTIHRSLGIFFTVLVVYAFIFALINVFGRHKRASIIPTIDDYKGVIADLKCSMGLGTECPRFGHFDYRQKFEYFGMVFGSIIIIISGFCLMFPVLVTSWLPGEAIPVSLTFHGFEATLAVLVIVVWHIYDAVLRPDIFPTDKTIFTGKISMERVKEEHALEYEEITGEKVD
jgi:formate dehydrogenase subunit gamma